VRAEDLERVVHVQYVLRSILALALLVNEDLLSKEADRVRDFNPSYRPIGLEIDRPCVA
jgi:hypothetical protein